MVPLQLLEKPVVEPQRLVVRLQRFRLVNYQQSPGCRYTRPRGKDFAQGTKMRKKEPAEHDIRGVDRKRNADDVMDLELKIGVMPRPRLLYEYSGGIQPDGSIRLQHILKQPGGPAGAAAEIHCQARRAYAATAQQFPRFRFVHFGESPQSRTGAQIIAERVFIGCRFPRLLIAHLPIFA